MQYPKVGDWLDKFQLKEVLGTGTTSKVYKSYNKYFRKDVVIKILSPDLIVKSSNIKDIFFEEAYILSKLHHPNIIQILDANEKDYSYTVMEYFEGQTLEDLIKEKGIINPRDAIRILIQVCLALDYIKMHNIVHRDIKPGNIIVSDTGIAKILDFGISKVIDEPVKYSLIGGPMCGTLYYMSPEQLTDSERVDHKADMYSLGATMYHMVTGKKPFETDNITELMMMHIGEIPKKPKLLSNEIIDEFSDLIMVLLEKSPSKRASSYQEIILSLDNIYNKYEKLDKEHESEKILAKEIEKINKTEEKGDPFSDTNILKQMFLKKLSKNDSNEIDKKEKFMKEITDSVNLTDKFLKNVLTPSNYSDKISKREEEILIKTDTNINLSNELSQKFLKNITTPITFETDNEKVNIKDKKLDQINEYSNNHYVETNFVKESQKPNFFKDKKDEAKFNNDDSDFNFSLAEKILKNINNL
ncbi:MAG: serine/threonine-protein kinase [Candidatus Sericytochromatia bacterium]